MPEVSSGTVPGLLELFYAATRCTGLVLPEGVNCSGLPGPRSQPNAANCLPLKSFIHAAPVYCSYLSGQWVIVANWLWFFTFIAAPFFIPPEPPMMESYQIGDYEEPLAGIQMH